VIQQADNYSIAGLAKEINRLAQEVRQGTLASKEIFKASICGWHKAFIN
jgi:2-oxoisovalerate dehydrogenase E2 component (dihydrolipoyl transacylase)